jgi:hypothetical protein
MRIRSLILSIAVLFSARTASAQFAGAGPAGFGGLNISVQSANAGQGETPGIRVSDTFLLHTGLAVGAGVDSNVYFQDTNQVSSAVTHIMPQIDLTNGGRGATPDVLLNVVLNGDYRQYYSSSVVGSEQSVFGVGAGATLDIGTNSPVTLTLLNTFYRDVQPPYVAGTGEFTRDAEQAGLRLRWRPGGGRLEEMLQYTLLYDHFEEAALSNADSLAHDIEFRSAFKFLPKTAVYLDFDQRFYRYLNSGVGKFNSNPFRVEAGLVGLVTPKMTASLRAGYGNGFYDIDPSPSTVVAGAELGWLIGPFARAKVGYEHDFVNSLYGNYYDLDALYAVWTQQVGSHFLGNLMTRWEHRNYHCPGNGIGMMAPISCFQDVNGADRVDNWVSLGIDAHYFPTPWFSAGAAYQLLANVSDFQLTTGGAATLPVRFVKHQVMGIVSVTY